MACIICSQPVHLPLLSPPLPFLLPTPPPPHPSSPSLPPPQLNSSVHSLLAPRTLPYVVIVYSDGAIGTQDGDQSVKAIERRTRRTASSPVWVGGGVWGGWVCGVPVRFDFLGGPGVKGGGTPHFHKCRAALHCFSITTQCADICTLGIGWSGGCLARLQ